MTSDLDSDFDEVELDERPELAAGFWRPWPYLLAFAVGWWYSRSWKALFASLPGIVLGGIPLVFLVLGRQTPVEERVDQYQAAAQAALARRDGAAAEVYFRRLAALNDVTPPTRYGLGLAAALQGDEARARSLMQSLAPEHAAGYAEAHLWLARDLLSQHSQLTPQAAKVLEHHLRQVLARDKTNEEATSLLGLVLWSRGDVQNALPYLEQTARRSPELQLPLAVLYEMRQDNAAAQNAAKRAVAHFSKAAESNPTAWEYRVRWAQSEALLKNFPEAVRILQAGLTSASPQPFHEALVGVYLAWYAVTPAQTPAGLATRLELLNQALGHGPNHPQVLTLLAELSIGDGKGADVARAALQDALTQGTAPATVHFVLGTQALLQGDLTSAEDHLELARQPAPEMPMVLNNLACALTQREPPDLERALKLAQAAKKLSNHPEISDTLGMILARQGKHREAITEFETVLRAFPNRSGLHSQLADLYEKLGDAEMSERHRRLVQVPAVDHK